VVDPSKKVSDLKCEVQDLLLEVVDLKQEVPDLRSDGIPLNLTPAFLLALLGSPGKGPLNGRVCCCVILFWPFV